MPPESDSEDEELERADEENEPEEEAEEIHTEGSKTNVLFGEAYEQ